MTLTRVEAERLRAVGYVAVAETQRFAISRSSRATSWAASSSEKPANASRLPSNRAAQASGRRARAMSVRAMRRLRPSAGSAVRRISPSLSIRVIICAMDGGHVHGRDAVRAYWTRQWTMVRPQVEPVRFTETTDGSIVVDVRQTVRDLEGRPLEGQSHGLQDKTIEHVFLFRNAKVARFDVRD